MVSALIFFWNYCLVVYLTYKMSSRLWIWKSKKNWIFVVWIFLSFKLFPFPCWYCQWRGTSKVVLCWTNNRIYVQFLTVIRWICFANFYTFAQCLLKWLGLIVLFTIIIISKLYRLRWGLLLLVFLPIFKFGYL